MFLYILADLISFLEIQRLQLAGSSSTVFAVNLILYYGLLLHVSVRMVRVREKVFGNNKGSRFNASFVDWTSVLVKSDLEASLSFTNIM